MINLEKTIGKERNEKLSRYSNVFTPTSFTVYHSTIIGKISTEFDECPILIEHTELPTLEILNSETIAFKNENSDFIDYIGDYFWLPIRIQNITFTGLEEKEELGDILLITDKGVFELEKATIDFENKLLIFKCGTLRN